MEQSQCHGEGLFLGKNIKNNLFIYRLSNKLVRILIFLRKNTPTQHVSKHGVIENMELNTILNQGN